jgi:hypothetical protein
MLRSGLCTEAQLTSPRFLQWAERMRVAWDPAGDGGPVPLHRKVWEWAFIAAALEERGMLAPGRRGLGFGVGTEPLTALFASYGCEIVATDLEPDAALDQGWASTGQHAAALDDLNQLGLCPADDFARNVSYRQVDMNHVPADLVGFDFCWSSCALEHLGSLAAGRAFVLASLGTLRRGGVAVHTTEFNVSSNDATVDHDGTVLYRRSDVESLAADLRRDGNLLDLDFHAGNGPADQHVDAAPYSSVHLKLRLAEFVVTSLGLVVERGAPSPAARLRRRYRRSAARIRSAVSSRTSSDA